MIPWRLLLLLLVLTGFVLFDDCRTNAQQQQQQQPEQPQAQVTLSLQEFEDLYTSAKLKDFGRQFEQERDQLIQEHQAKLALLQQQSLERDRDQVLRRLQAQEELFPQHFQVLQYSAAGIFNSSSPEQAGVEGDTARFDLELMVRVMESSSSPSPPPSQQQQSPGGAQPWTVVPLVNTTATVAGNWRVFCQEEDSATSSASFIEKDPITNPSVLLLQRNEQQVLVTNVTGLYKIQFHAYTRVGKSRNLNTLSFSNLLYPMSHLEFRIVHRSPTTGVQDLSIRPPSAVMFLQPSDTYTDIQATLPLNADSFQLRWVDVEEHEQEEGGGEGGGGGSKMHSAESSTPQQQQVAVVHQVMHTIGEGIVQSQHSLEYTTTSSDASPLNSVQFWVRGERVRVTSVEGHALHSWTMSEVWGDDATNNSTSSTTTPAILVKAIFKTSQVASQQVVLHVHTETDRGNGGAGDPGSTNTTSTIVELPRIECQNAIRQTGHVGVIKDANVEVHEHKIGTLSRVEASELSSKLRLNVDRPIVLSYKYLNRQQNQVVLAVQEHEAMETLEATIDRMHYKVVLTETHAVHSIILILQSIKLQYLKMSGLPLSSSKFTVLVNSAPAKPVKGGAEGSDILIPLLVGLNPESANQGCSFHTSVEVTFFSTHDEALGVNGTILLKPPQFDLPISVLSTHLSLPSHYRYNFTGGFGTEPLEKSRIYPIPEAFRYVKGKRVVPEDYEFTILDDMFPEDRDEQAKSGAVRIVTPSAGRNFHFQKLLVLDRGLCLNVTYSQPLPRGTKKSSLLQMLYSLFRSKN
ncbi:hypothetical protein ACA910_002016 [Epithemia clementina (nom. ined.)]